MRVFALLPLGISLVRSEECYNMFFCAPCLNMKGCTYCPYYSDMRSGHCDTPNWACSSGFTPVTDREDCPPVECKRCWGSTNVVRVNFGKDTIVVKCINKQDPGCRQQDHVVNAVKCFHDQGCGALGALDSRLLLEGQYPYLADACFNRQCHECLDGTGKCEYYSETVDGETTYNCVPAGFFDGTATLVKVDQCPCTDETTCATCLNRGDCVFCSEDAQGMSGKCDYLCESDTSLTDRKICPAIQCSECTGSTNIFQLVYKEDGVEATCVNEKTPGCKKVDHVVNAVRCYDDKYCSTVEKEDPRFITEGTYPYKEGSCWGRFCPRCFDGTGQCEYFSETVDGQETFNCVPAGFLTPSSTLSKLDTCPNKCYKEANCATCLNQVGCTFCATDDEGKSGICYDTCETGTTTLTDRSTCPAVTCEDCTGTTNVYQLVYEESGVAVTCVNGQTPGCSPADHVVNAVRCYHGTDCSSITDNQLLIEGKYPYPEDTCWGRRCHECIDGTGLCEFFTENVSGKHIKGCAPAGFLKPRETLTKLEKCPDKVACDDCDPGQTYSVKYGTTGVHAACVEHCTPAQLPVGATYCYDTTKCDQINDEELVISGFYPYPMGSCFTKVCSACKSAIDESGQPLCEFMVHSEEEGKDIMGCVPTGFLSGNDLYEAEYCPLGNTAGKLFHIIMANAKVLVAFALVL